ARPQLLHGRADALDRAGALVAEDAREGNAEIVVAAVHVGLAHAAGGDADDQLIGPGIGELERFEPERRAFLRNERRRYAHALSPSTRAKTCSSAGTRGPRSPAPSTPWSRRAPGDARCSTGAASSAAPW